MRRLPWLAMLCVMAANPAHADVLDRAKALLEARSTDRPLLVSYADSLRDSDVRIATRCLEVAGIAAFRANELDEALQYWQRGVQWAREADSQEAESSLLNALAIGYTVRGEVESALPVYDRALELRAALADTLGLGRTWGNLAQAYTNLGRTAEALQAAQEQAEWLTFVDNPDGQLASAMRRAQLLAQLGRFDEALLAAQQAVDLAPRARDASALGLAHMTLGNAHHDLGQADQALPLLERAHQELSDSGDAYSAQFAEQSIVHALLKLERYEEALQKARRVAAAVEASGHDPLLTVMLRSQGHALFSLGRYDEAESVLRQALDHFEARRQSLSDEESRAGIFRASGECYAALARSVQHRGDTREAVAILERGRGALFRDRNVAEGADFDLDRLQARLSEEHGAVVLFNDPAFDPLAAYVIDAGGVSFVEIGGLDALVADAQAALRLLAAGEDLSTCQPALRRMSEALSWKLLDVLQSKAPTVDRVFLVPPSSLVGFPLGLLQSRDGVRWQDQWAISYLPNAMSLLTLNAREIPSGSVSAFADPSTGAVDDRSRLPSSTARALAGVPLPEARAEIATLRDVADSTLRSGDEATGAALRQALSQPSAVLHLATHAVVDASDGSRSAVVLRASESSQVDAVTAEEIAAAAFEGDLVVLSGCSTFGRDRILGEGWFGLPRAFLDAGARSVLSTLWDVDDRGARRFVEHFYDGLREGLSRDVALQQAQRRCEDDGIAPREWAAFVLTGVGSDPVPVLAAAGPTGGSIGWGISAAFLLSGLLGGAWRWWRRRRDR